MGIRIGSTVVNCADIETMTDLWTKALDLTPSSREPGGDFPQFERLQGLGARFVREHIGDDEIYVVLLDPEGNEFCVCEVARL